MKKKTYLYFYIFLIIPVILISCASRPVVVETAVMIETAEVYVPPPETIIPSPEPPLPPPAIERIVEQVKNNGAEIEKFFVFGANSRITVKANLKLDDADFEVTYNLEEAADKGNSEYEVQFTVLEKDTDNSQTDTLLWKPAAGNAGLLLSFDDDYYNTWEQYLDFFDEYGVKVTFFIMGSYVPFSTTALSRGHDVGFHTLNHKDLRQLSLADFNMEAIESAQSFRREGVPVTSLAFPYGFSDSWMYDILLKHYSVLRGYGTTFRLYDTSVIGSGYIISRAIDNTVLQGEENFENTIRIMLRTVKFMDKNWVLPLTSHDISNGSWAIRHRRLEFLLKTAVELRLKFYKFSDFD